MPVQSMLDVSALFHGTTKNNWMKGREGQSTLYLTRSRRDAENYAEETSESEWEEDHTPVQVIAAIGGHQLQTLAEMPGVEIHPDWGWVEGMEHENSQEGVDSKREYTWQESFNACGCVSISGFTDEHKGLFVVDALDGSRIKIPGQNYEKKQKKKYTQAELESLDLDFLDRMAFGYVTDELAWLDPEDLTIIYAGDMENPDYRFKSDGMEWVKEVDLSEPVKVSIDTDGKLCLEDGHHRYFAAKKRREKLIASIEIKGNPIKAILSRQAEKAHKMDREAGFGMS